VGAIVTLPPTEDPSDHPEQLDDAVRLRRKRREHWQREGERSIGQNLAMIGALGWTIVTPTLIGIFAGRWLDRVFGSGIFWTLGLLVAGLAVGCALGWKRMYRE
jgi:ATP synthase protein I